MQAVGRRKMAGMLPHQGIRGEAGVPLNARGDIAARGLTLPTTAGCLLTVTLAVIAGASTRAITAAQGGTRTPEPSLPPLGRGSGPRLALPTGCDPCSRVPG